MIWYIYLYLYLHTYISYIYIHGFTRIKITATHSGLASVVFESSTLKSQFCPLEESWILSQNHRDVVVVSSKILRKLYIYGIWISYDRYGTLKFHQITWHIRYNITKWIYHWYHSYLIHFDLLLLIFLGFSGPGHRSWATSQRMAGSSTKVAGQRRGICTIFLSIKHVFSWIVSHDIIEFHGYVPCKPWNFMDMFPFNHRFSYLSHGDVAIFPMGWPGPDGRLFWHHLSLGWLEAAVSEEILL